MVKTSPYTARELAEVLGVCDCTVRNWVRQRKIRAIVVGQTIRIPLDEAERILAGRRAITETKTRGN